MLQKSRGFPGKPLPIKLAESYHEPETGTWLFPDATIESRLLHDARGSELERHELYRDVASLVADTFHRPCFFYKADADIVFVDSLSIESLDTTEQTCADAVCELFRRFLGRNKIYPPSN
jgi:hypothetical protein